MSRRKICDARGPGPCDALPTTRKAISILRAKGGLSDNGSEESTGRRCMMLSDIRPEMSIRRAGRSTLHDTTSHIRSKDRRRHETPFPHFSFDSVRWYCQRPILDKTRRDGGERVPDSRGS